WGTASANAVPEMEDLVDKARAQPARTHQSEINLTRNGISRTLLTRMAAEFLDGEVIGYVATFDDVTDLLSAQRKAAWA
ncbi:MAG: two-component sensor histidine kinase, partial [Rhodospirillaceae bacterium]